MRTWFRLLALITAVATVMGVALIPVTAASAAPTPSPQATPWPQGVWVGTYTCRQGLTGLMLTIGTIGNTLGANFKFYAVPRNPGVPDGEFRMEGTYSSSGLQLNGLSWISQPPGWEMVDLRSGPPTNGGNSLTGSITTDGCTTFSVQRAVTNPTACPPPLPSNPFSSTLPILSLQDRIAWWNLINNSLNPCLFLGQTPEEFFGFITEIWGGAALAPILVAIFGPSFLDALAGHDIYTVVHEAWLKEHPGG